MIVGKSVPRVDAFDKVTGRAKYTDDLCDKSALLIGKLKRFVSSGQAEKVTRHLYIADRLKAENHQLLYIVDAVTEAINEGKKIRFLSQRKSSVTRWTTEQTFVA